MFSGRQDQGRVRGNCGQQVEPGGVRALIGRQRETFAMRQLADFDFHGRVHEFCSTFFAIFATSSVATCSLVITGQESTLISLAPSRVSRWTVLRSPPITPVAGDTSLATIQSQPLRATC